MAEPDRLARLTAARDAVATALAACDNPRDLPALSREYRLLLAELADLTDHSDGDDIVDQLAKRRRTKASPPAKPAPQRRRRGAGAS